MKKTSLILGLALGLSFSSPVFADGWDYSKHSPRARFTCKTGSVDMTASNWDYAKHDSRIGTVHVSDEIGKMTVIRATKGSISYTRTIAVVR